MTNVFHQGEVAIQTESGVEERMHKVGNAFIRDHIIDQHKDFFEKLPYVFIALQDKSGRPWVSLMQGEAGFISSPNNKTLNLNGRILGADQLDLQADQDKPVGIVGLDLSTRRRNRLNGNFKAHEKKGILSIAVHHSFGNCPKYIQLRSLETSDVDHNNDRLTENIESFDEFNQSDVELIRQSDTLFIASAEHEGGNLDASHRGGKSGFVRVNNTTQLWFNDYPGNNLYQTFGNIYNYSRVGLLFLDFETGDLLLLSGEAQLEKTESADNEIPKSKAKPNKFLPRRFSFTLGKGIRLKRAVYGRWSFEELSPFLNDDLD